MPTARRRNTRSRPGNGIPCRHCLRLVAEGEPFSSWAHRPFPAPQPYAEQGPIFLHAKACPRHEGGGAVPSMLGEPTLHRARLLQGNDRIVYGSGQIVPTGEIPFAAAAMFEDPRIAYIHVRSASRTTATSAASTAG